MHARAGWLRVLVFISALPFLSLSMLSARGQSEKLNMHEG